MKYVLIVSMLLALPGMVAASPLTDVIIGGVLIVNGGVFEFQRSKAKKKKQTAQEKGTVEIVKALNADEQAFYFAGIADWEQINFGQTSIYFEALSISSDWGWQARNHANSSVGFFKTADSQKSKQNLYKGVSLTSFAIGSVFVVKGAIGYLVRRERKESLLDNFTLSPTRRLDGAQIRYEYKWR